ncbi:unnamed protein product [Spirodela intermedia]|uniref:Uncharacterized protein n=1 Tax=Spirodela intermedia TaxID=51605 RepID=A0A7I8IV35_SPIIN|nr:unnamed protein product [Spirodela intermedia]CAA6661629.1 unnamed protein product [Spirodela intermedia]
MASSGVWWMLFLLITMAGITRSFCSQVYVVYLGGKTGESQEEVMRKNHQLLIAVHGGSEELARESHVYSYSNGFRGFAAKLSEEQAKAMAVVSVFPNLRRQLHTTHSWDFMGLATDEAMEIPGFFTKNQENVIIGFIDTVPSFHDNQMPPVPTRWKGVCQAGEASSNFSCNRKIVGARYYSSGFVGEMPNSEPLLGSDISPAQYKSPRDSAGHGSHTASTAAGRFVSDMDFNGLASGGARGGAPLARIAVYKTCWSSGCYDADILAAFDDAIRDGVDILSLSLGPDPPQGNYFSDAISVGSFHAASHGILVVSSVGNVGAKGSATNLAPWMLTVGAGSTDRDFASYILLGDGTRIMGESLNAVGMTATATIIPASHANAGYFTRIKRGEQKTYRFIDLFIYLFIGFFSTFCLESSLNQTKARGKVLICRQAGRSSESKLAKSTAVKNAGGVGMILIDELDKDIAVPFTIPAATVGKRDGDQILSYINRKKGFLCRRREPRSLIFPARTIIGSRPAPWVTAFSSKGPNSLTPEILKPDVAAPGLNILAAWSPAAQQMSFNILSGTSMACPHVTGIAALIKAVYPSWSPSAIKSAIMTTARGKAGDPLRPWVGLLDPPRVLNPGLDFLCAVGYDNKTRHLVTGNVRPCPQPSPPAHNLNYPAIAAIDIKGGASIIRTVTNVGSPRSIYRSVVSPPPGISVTVVPTALVFTSYGQRISFTVSFSVAARPPAEGYSFGSLSWRSADAEVRSPLIVSVASSSL